MYTLTSNQLSIWFDHNRNPKLPLYNIGGYFSIEGKLDIEILQIAHSKLIEENDVFRMKLVSLEGEPRQKFWEERDTTLPLKDFSDRKNPEEDAKKWMQEEFSRPILLDHFPLHKTFLIKVRGDLHYYLSIYHHIMIDGWGISLHFKYLCESYNHLLAGTPLEKKEFSYQDYTEIAANFRDAKSYDDDVAYWKEKFTEIPPLLFSRAGRNQDHVSRVHGGRESFYIPWETYEKIQQTCKALRVSVFHYFLAIIAASASKLYGRDQLTIGIPLLNRSNFKEKRTIGLFTGMSPLLSTIEPGDTFSDLISRIRGTLRADYRHQSLPISEINKVLSLQQQGRSELFDLTLSYEKHEYNFNMEGSHSRMFPLSNLFEQQPIAIYIREYHAGQQVDIDFKYNFGFFSKGEIDAYVRQFEFLLYQFLENPEISLEALELLSPLDKENIQPFLLPPSVEIPGPDTVHTAFEQTAEKFAHCTAVEFQKETLSFKQLNVQANQLAHHLLGQPGFQTGAKVGILLARSLQLPVAILATLKAGGVFVPLDPELPANRIQFLLEDSECQVLVTTSGLLSESNISGIDCIVELDQTSLDSQPASNPESVGAGGTPAYLIYTSGSTGKPKGVQVSHANLLNYTRWAQSFMELTPEDCSLLLHSFAFDGSYTNLFGALLTGHRLCVVSKEMVTTPSALIDYIAEKEVTYIKATPSMFASWLASDNWKEETAWKKVRILMLGGEGIRYQDVECFHAQHPHIRFINHYGPTETTIGSLAGYIDFETFGKEPHIGKPIFNTGVCILTPSGDLVPWGLPGELCISGTGVTLGYFNRPDQTEKAFVNHPYVEGERLYRTGDRARWLPDGNIAWMGRMDEQVKVRGYRIEPAEIENALSNCPGVVQIAVLAKENEAGKPYLVGYWVEDGKQQQNDQDLRDFALSILPEYMVPHQLLKLKALPFNSRGKLDRGVLKAIEVVESRTKEAGTLPHVPVLMKVWKEILKIKTLQPGDNFFALGGDSIKALQIVSRLRNENLKCEIGDIFRFPILVDLARRVEPLQQQVDQGTVEGNYPLIPIQAEFFQQKYEHPHWFNHALHLQSPNRLDENQFQEALYALVEHHDALRSVFLQKNGEWQANILGKEAKPGFELNDMTGEADAIAQLSERMETLQSGFELSKGPLVKAALFRMPEGDQVTLVIHHLVVDAVSWRIIAQDLLTGYEQLQAGKPVVLPAKSDSFSTWAQALQSTVETPVLREEIDLWRELENTPVQPLIYDQSGAEPSQAELRKTRFSLSSAATRDFQTRCHKAFRTTPEELILASVVQGLDQWLGSGNHALWMEAHGREPLFSHIDLSRTVGWFTSRYPLILNGKGADPISRIREIKEQVRKIPNKGLGYGRLRFLHDQEFTKALRFDLKPRIQFNYLGALEQQTGAIEVLGEQVELSMAPTEKRGIDLNLEAKIVDSQLQVELAFASNRFSEATVSRFLKSLEKGLLENIQVCLDQTEPVLTPADLTFKQMTVEGLDELLANAGIAHDQLADLLPVSPLQEGILFHTLLEEESDAYFAQKSFRITGTLDLKIFQAAWEQLVQRHELLRSRFLLAGTYNRNLQAVLKERKPGFQITDLTGLISEEQKKKIAQFKELDRKRSFDLQHDPLFRIQVMRLAEKEFFVCISHSHIILDGWSMGIIFPEFFKFYQNLLKGIELNLPSIPTFGEYIQWQENLESTGQLKAFWTQYLAGFEERTPLPCKLRKAPGTLPRVATHEFAFSPEQTSFLNQLAAENQVTLNIVVTAIWGLLLANYNTRDEAVFGTSMAGRPAELAGIGQVAGMFINTLPVRIQHQPGQTFKDYLCRLQEDYLQREKNQFYPLAEIQASSPLAKDLFDHILVFENYPIDERLHELPSRMGLGFEINGVEIFEQTNFDLTLVVYPGDSLRILFYYDEESIGMEAVRMWQRHLVQMADSLRAGVDQPTDALQYLAPEEVHQLIYGFNETQTEYPRELTLEKQIESMVEAFPDRVALEYNGKKVTYSELNSRANQLAHHLLDEYQLAPQEPVGVLMTNSDLQIITLVAILKAGGNYVPCDPDYPDERIHYILSDVDCRILISEGELTNRLGGEIGLIILDAWEAGSSKDHNPDLDILPDHLCYILYTSGSTGNPKGCMVEHGNVISLMINKDFPYELGPEDVSVFAHSYCFDVSVFEMYGALLFGGSLIIPDRKEIKDVKGLLRLVQENRISVLSQTPGAFYNFIDAARDAKAVSLNDHLRYVVFGGEKLEFARLIPWTEMFPPDKIALVNMYGITEITVHATVIRLSLDDILNAEGESSVGVPLPETSIYLLDAKQRPVPVGIPGEIYVGGCGVIRGYWGKPELTAERYLSNPYVEGDRMFRSGDQARWTEDGNIIFLNRLDDQVKIRGFRVETQEIVQRLLSHPKIIDTAVLARPNQFGQNELLAYIVVQKESEPLEIASLREFLSGYLPEYMLPSHFFQLDQLPLTHNKKLDKKALPVPGQGELKVSTKYIAPRNRMERELVRLFEETLEKEKVGIQDNFFHLGGHSLKATSLVSRIQKLLKLPITLADLFVHPTVEGLIQATAERGISFFDPIPALEKKRGYPLSEAQRRLWVLQRMAPESVEYNITEAFLLKGAIQVQALQQAVEILVNRHESLRTRIETVEGVPEQVIDDSVKVTIKIEDLSKGNHPERAALTRAKSIAALPFDLAKGPLFHLSLLNLGADQHMLVVSMHHIITDGWSMAVLVRELLTLYPTLLAQKSPQLPALPVQYKEYASWMNQWVEEEPRALKAREFWMNTFTGEIPKVEMPTDFKRPRIRSGKGAACFFRIQPEIVRELEQLGKQKGASLFMALQALVKTLLFRYTRQEDLIVGTPVAGRAHPDLQGLVGYFINTLPIRDEVVGKESFLKLLEKVRPKVEGVLEHQMYPIDRLLSGLNLERDTSRNPLYDIVVVLQNTESTDLTFDGVEAKRIPFDHGTAKFDLTFTFTEEEEGLNLKVEYATDLFKASSAEQMGNHLIQLLQAVVETPEEPIEALAMLSASEKAELFDKLNDTRATYPEQVTLVDLFEQSVDQYSDAVAVVSGDTHLTYEEVNRRANQIAHYLIREFEIEPGDLISVVLDRHEWIPVALLAIIKTGAAYVPIDPTYPENRQAYMLGDTAGRVILSEAKYSASLAEMTIVPVLDVRKITEEAEDNPQVKLNPDLVAYVIYTSGSTGKPKGCLVTHRNLVRLMFNDRHPFDFNASDVWVMAHSFCFDFSVWEMYGALLYGGKLVLPPREEVVDTQKFLDLVRQHKVTVLNQTPGAFYNFLHLEGETPGSDLSDHLRYVIFGGDKLDPGRLAPWIERHPLGQTALINMYGITETTIHVTFHSLTEQEILAADGSSPIGVPLPETEVYILNEALQPMPRGAIGEMYVGGTGVAKGYLNRSRLTRQRFIKDPFVSGKRLYKTGDLGRWTVEGILEFHGRSDNQVKIRGFRIETGEVISHLNKLPAIAESAVVAIQNEEGYQELAAYLRFEEGHVEPDATTLRNTLAQTLPDYMIPVHFIPLEKIPLTANGKLDRKALPTPGEVSLQLGSQFAAPGTREEKVLAPVFAELLGREQVGIHDNFFSLGGDSIKAMQIVSRLNKEGYALDVRDIFSFPTVSELGPRLGQVSQTADQSVVAGEIGLTPIQHWLFANFASQPYHYNQSATLFNDKWFNQDALQVALDAIFLHHDQLRAFFRFEGGKWKQTIRVKVEPVPLNIVDLRTHEHPLEELERCATQAQSGLEMSGPLLNWTLYQLPDGDRLHMVVHHLLIDGVSWRILLEDLQVAYQQATWGENIELPAKTTSFQLWSEYLSEYAESPELHQEVDFWNQQAGRQFDKLEVNHPESENTYGGVDHFAVSLEEAATRELMQQANKAYFTEINDLLLTALGRALHEWQGMDQVQIILEGHGREVIQKEIDLNRTVGWFTTLYPFALTCNVKDQGGHLKMVKESLRQIPGKGLGFGVLKYLSETKMKSSETPARISFNYLGQFDNSGLQEGMKLSTAEVGGEVSPRSRRYLELEIAAVVADGKMKIDFGYHKDRFEPANIQKLAELMRTQLKALTDHCISRSLPEKTPGNLTYHSISIQELDLLRERVQVAPHKLEDLYPLSPMQAGMLFHAQLNPASTDYVEQFSIRLEGKLNLEHFRKGWEILVQSFEPLRTLIISDGGDEPLQMVLTDRPLDLQFRDLRKYPSQEQESRLAHARGQDRKDGFRLDKDPLFRMVLSRLEDEKWNLLISHHHIILDGWSLQILFGVFFENYFALEQGNPPVLPRMTPYREHIKWLSKRDYASSGDWWEAYLSGYETPVSIPGIRTDIQGKGSYAVEDLVINAAQQELLQTLSQASGASLNTLMVSAWGLLLAKYNTTGDAVFGVTVSGRSREVGNVEEMVGLYINTVPVRVQFEKSTTFSELVSWSQNSALEREPHEYFPLGSIQSRSELKNHLLDHVMVFENYPLDERVKSSLGGADSGFRLESMETYEKTNYPFLVVVRPGKQLTVSFNYDPGVIPYGQVKQVREHFDTLLNNLLREPELPVIGRGMLSNAEKIQLHETFNATHTDFPRDLTIESRVALIAGLYPDSIAVEAGEDQITYGELERRAHGFALSLVNQHQIQPGDIVGVLAERNISWIVTMLGIWQVGAIYLPLDPEHPHDRRVQLLSDARAKLWVAPGDLDTGGGPIPVLDPTQMAEGNGEVLERANDPRSIAFLIYTSGSSGKPKGVLVEHQGFVNMALFQADAFGVKPESRVLQFASPAFDASLSEIFMALFTGATLVMVEKEVRKAADRLGQFILEQEISVLTLPPALLTHVPKAAFSGVKTLITAGEAPGLNDVVYFSNKLNYFNAYGPTEYSVCATLGQVKEVLGSADAPVIPMGRPIANTRIYVLDRNQQPVPLGTIGEIYVSGPGLARGYLGQPDLTAQFFLANPFSDSGDPDHHRMYRTGDLGEWQSDGQLVFRGRADAQVKIRGARVEPAEIAAVLSGFSTLKTAWVGTVKGRGGQLELAAWFVAENPEYVPAYDILVEELRKRLPDFMIPSYFVSMEALPLTLNGKIDKQKLPDPMQETLGVGSETFLPESRVQEVLVSTFEEVLRRENIGKNDNYFALGGDSIKALQIISRLRTSGIQLEVADLFNFPTISELAAKAEKVSTLISQHPVSGPVTLNPIQRWFFETWATDHHHFNQEVLLQSQEPLDAILLQTVLEALQLHHDGLRTLFRKGTEGWTAEIPAGTLPLDFHIVDLELHAPAEKAIRAHGRERHTGIQLEQGPLFRSTLYRHGDTHYLHLFANHLVVDGVSWRILLEDLSLGYGQALTGATPRFQSKTHSFQDWAEALQEYATTRAAEEMPYWKRTLATLPPAIPTDHDSGQSLHRNTQKIKREWTDSETGMMIEEVQKAYGTRVSELLLTALARALREQFDQVRNLIFLEGQGRTGAVKGFNLDRTVGWFTAAYPVVLETHGQDPAGDLRAVMENLRAVPEQGVGFSVLKYLSPPVVTQGVNFKFPAQISFNYLGEVNSQARMNRMELANWSPGGGVSADAPRFHELDFVAMIRDGKLQITLSFDPGLFEKAGLVNLMDKLEKELKELSAHCISVSEGGGFQTELTIDELSEEDFDAILDLID